jgi:hypothetical protein
VHGAFATSFDIADNRFLTRLLSPMIGQNPINATSAERTALKNDDHFLSAKRLQALISRSDQSEGCNRKSTA